MNNKYILVSAIFLYFIILTLLMNSLSLSTTGNVTDGIIAPSINTGLFGGIDNIIDFIKIFWRLLTFSLDGIPVVVSLICIYPPLFIVIHNVINILRGTS